ncbi:MAG: hypothetical protein GYA57_14870 [Myxococcales bacterium]|nr:hypothetical protein [Myxococcales bacterium]
MAQARARRESERPAAGLRPLLGLLVLLAAACGHDWTAADGATDGGDGTDGGGDGTGDDGVEAEATLCGNGARDPGEECDNGPANSDTAPDACRTDCVRAHCGDGVVDSRETCDDGNDIDDDACRNDCALATCGDGVVDSGEACDDGNRSNADACLNTCAAASCGDGFVWEGVETCDSPDPIPCATECGSTGTQSCLDCRPAGTCIPPAETCNGRDDDCDGERDDGFDCSPGDMASCTTRCGSVGRGPCTATCEPADIELCEPPDEICNAADDDCDTLADEDFPCVRGQVVPCATSCGTTGTGACIDTCEPPDATACTPPPEVCDGVDQDCDTLVDDDLECRPGTTEPCTVGTCTGTRTCAETCTWSPCNLGSPPAEDDCEGWPRTISDSLGTRTVTGDTCGAADDFSTVDCGGSGGPDVVYRLTLRTRRLVTLDTTGTSFDAVLSVRGPGGTCPGPELVCDDDSAGGTPGQARIVAVLEPATYWVVIDGKTPGDTGDYVLTVNVADPGSVPVNDSCAGAVPLTYATGGMRSVLGSTASASHFSGGGCAAAGPDVWYSLSLPEPAVVYLDTLDGQTWDSVVEVRSGDCSASTLAGCGQDACGGLRSQWVGRLDAGTHYVLVDGRRTIDRGTFTLRYQVVTGACATDAVALAADGTYSGTTLGAANHSEPGCGTAWGMPDAVFAFGGCEGLSFSASTCSSSTMLPLDTVLTVFRDSCIGAALACNDDDPDCPAPGGSTVTVSGLNNRLHFLVVDGGARPPASGPFQLTVDLP